MRGKARGFCTFCLCCRITPAYAGKSRGAIRGREHQKDHPRLCGEKLERIRLYKPDSGSPPPMRGKVLRFAQKAYASGITPAYAGKSFKYPHAGISARDHPRLCGEKFSNFIFHSSQLGSPPPMRGKGCTFGAARKRRRITPAYAGKSVRFCALHLICEDHPRLCGEKFRLLHPSEMRLGSPPPMRGKAAESEENIPINRITPAYAGKSDMDSPDFSRSKDHPRLCGEKLLPEFGCS